MEQSLQGVSFPAAAAAKTELMQHNHDAAEPWSASNPHPGKRKGIARPWMGWGVGDGKEKVKLQDQMMKRKRDGGTVSTVSVASVAGNESTPKSSEKFELDYLRHDGHFHTEQKKGPVLTFVKLYFRQKWRDNNPETEVVRKSNRLEYKRGRKEVEPWSRSKQRLEYAKTGKQGPKEGSNSERLGYAQGQKEAELVIKEYERAETQPLSMRLEAATAARDGTPILTIVTRVRGSTTACTYRGFPGSEGQLYPPARAETEPKRSIENLEYITANEEDETQAHSRGKDLDYTKEEETHAVSKIKGFEYKMEVEETQPVRRRSSLGDYPTAREETETLRKIKRWELATPEGEAEKMSKSSLSAQTKELDGESPTSTNSNIKWGLPCGTDCNQVRTDIFRKTNSLMRRKPEKLHIKPRPKPSTSSDEDEDQGPISAEHHQAVQTIFTESKKVQTASNEPKQVQWAILPKDSHSPKVHRPRNEFQRHPRKMQYFRDDSVLMKVSVEPRLEPSHEIPVKAELLFDREIDNSGKGILDPQVDSPDLGGGKRPSAPHHLLLYQEALEIAKEQRDLDRAREQRQEFWSVYEQELKRGRGWRAQESKSERKGKWAADEDETPSFAHEVSSPGKAKFNAFVDEHLNLGSTTPVSSSTRDESGSNNQEAAAIFKKLLEKVESYETSPKGDDLVGLQGLRKTQAADNVRSIEAMEQQLNPETSQPTAQLSPTELDCMKAAILSHSFYPRLVTSFINQHKAGAPPDQVAQLEKIRGQVMESWHPSDNPVTKPAHEEKIKKYQDILTKFERELEKPFQDAMDFSWHMEHYLDGIPPSRGRSEIGSSGDNNLKEFDAEQYGFGGFN